MDIIDAVMESHREFMHGFEDMPIIFALDGFGDVSAESKKYTRGDTTFPLTNQDTWNTSADCK